MIKAKVITLLGAVMAATLLAALGWAEEAKAPAQPYIVLVGISKYQDEKIKPRVHGEDDAKAFYDLFTSKEHRGVDPAQVKLLLGSPDEKRGSQPATRENILKALEWAATNAKANDPVIFAFFGNGGPLGDLGDRRCYFASNSTLKGRDKDAVAASDIQDALKNLKSQQFAAFIDVDFKGYTGDANSTEPGLGKSPYAEFLGEDDGNEDHNPLGGRVLFLATNGLSTSLDLKEDGLFATAVLEGLKGGADKDGYEPDGRITVDELSEYLDKRIPRLAVENGKTKEEKNQLHFVLGGRVNHFILTRNPEAAARAEARVKKIEELGKEGKLPPKYVAEGKTLLERMPRLEAQRSLRKEYQAFVDGKTDLSKFETMRDAILEGTRLREVDAVRYAKKVIEATQLMKENYVKDLKQPDLVAWAVKGLYRRIDEKVPTDLDTKLKAVKEMNEEELTQLLADARLRLGKREDLDKAKDLHYTLQRMLSNLDPYTTYIDPETKDAMARDINGNFTGIGVQIRKDNVSDMLLVVTPIKNSPAYKAGIEAGDIITTIIRDADSMGNPLPKTEVTSTKGFTTNDAVKLILGKEGTKVKLVVQREGEKEPRTFEITRGRVDVETVLGIKRNPTDDWDYMIDKDNKIGYLRLTQFSRNSYRDMLGVMSKLTKQGVKGFILDLRFNPGGLLDSAVRITDLFVADGLIVSIRPRAGREQKFNGDTNGSLLDFPMVCMVNGMSASGSEIVSAALQDHHRAYIIGERSYGKGSVQNIQPFEGGDIKFTTATFWRPNGKNLNKSSTKGKEDDVWGVTPDKIVPLSRKEREDLAEAQRNAEIISHKEKTSSEGAKAEFKDKQLDAALEYLRGQINLGGGTSGKKVG